MTFGRGMLEHWPLDPDITYLNHGTVGAVPKRVLARQQSIRDEIERQPSRFLLRELASFGASTGQGMKMRTAADAVARFLGAQGPDVVFVDNATGGANAVLRSMPLEPGDEILTLDHNYGAVACTARYVARERGAAVRAVAVPYPDFDPSRLVEAVADALTPRTRIAVIDHITSESALVLPLAAIAARCREKDVPVLADGAHAPGAIEVDIPALGVDWYVANLHKWAHAPRSCGILWAAPTRQAMLHPPVISWGLDEGFTQEFDWVGTRDPSPWLAAPEGIAMLRDLDFAKVRAYNHGLAWSAVQALTQAWSTPLSLREDCVGTMVTVPLPDALGDRPEAARRLRDALLFEDQIEVQLHAGYGRLWVRLSAQIYNDTEDVARLADAVNARR